MDMKKNVLCVIPARIGSKGVPRKNLRDLNGKPLVYYAINAAKNCPLIDHVVVSTESEEVAAVAKSFGVEIPFLRPDELAQDSTPLFPVLLHALHYFDALGWRADIVISFQPTSPFTRSEDLEKGIKKMLDTDCDSVASVCRIEQYHPFRALKLVDDKTFPLTEYTTEKFVNRQDRPSAYAHNGAFYIRKRELLERWDGSNFALGEDTRAVVMDSIHSINIDSILDLKLAELILRENLLKT